MILFWVVVFFVLLFGSVVFFGAPYVPSLRKEVRRAFEELYPVGGDDLVVDLGSGDGVVLQEAAHRGARGIGYEINPVLVVLSSLRLRGKASVRLQSMWSVELPTDATLIYIFSVSRDSRKLGRYLQAQADRQNRALRVMTFGTGLKDYSPVKTLNAHSLYELTPSKPALQS